MKTVRPLASDIKKRAAEEYEKRFERRAGSGNSEAKLNQLHLGLRDAAKAYNKGNEQRREAVCSSVIAVLEFLGDEGFSDEVLIPFSRVLWAVEGISKRQSPDPLFCEKPKRYKRKRSLLDAALKGQIAAIADAWLDGCSDADEKIAQKLQRLARGASGPYFGELTLKRIESARKYQAQQGHPDVLYGAYVDMQKILRAEAEAFGPYDPGPKAAVEAQINALNAIASARKG